METGSSGVVLEREEALELLRANHTFPGPFEFRVVVHPHAAQAAVSAMIAGAGPAAELVDVRQRESRTGRYLALCVALHVAAAERVLDVYEVLRAVDGVVTSM